MWNSLLHFLGLCPCCHSHFDLLDLLLFGGPIIAYIIYKIKSITKFFKDCFKS